MSVCTNCSHPLQEQSNYCSQCGQSIIHYDKPLKPVLIDMLHESLDIDGRLLLSLKTLLFKPGLLTLEYNNGMRKKYTPPLRMYLAISIIFFFLISILETNYQEITDNMFSHSEYYPRLMFVLLPVFALILQLMFRGTFYLSNLIFAIHIHCVSYLVFLITLPLEMYEFIHPVFILIQIILFVYLLFYTALALKKYYAQSWLVTIIKFFICTLSYMAIIVAGIKLMFEVFP